MLQKGKPAALTFIYDGKLTGSEESPVFGIKFAAIHPDFAYLMYPARWFPVNDYTTRSLHVGYEGHGSGGLQGGGERHRQQRNCPLGDDGGAL